MSPQKITQQAEKIRELIVEDDLEKAFDILMDLAKKADGNYWDESLNLNQDYTKLTNEVRSGFLTPIQAETNRNLLIDRMLKLTRLIEDNEGKAPSPSTEDKEKTINKTVTVQNPPASSGFSRILFGVLGLGILAALMFFFSEKDKEIPTPVEPKIDRCKQTLDEGKTAFKEGDMNKAERIFITAKDACAGNGEAEKWLKRVQIMRERNATSKKENTNIENAQQTEKNTTSNRRVVPKVQEEIPSKEEKINPVKPSFPEENVDSRQVYISLRKKGDKAFQEKRYADAYEIYKQAKAINPTSEIRGKLEATRDLCYRQFFTAGMDDYNAQNYKEALVDFKKAQSYKDFAQVKGMIKRCERALE